MDILTFSILLQPGTVLVCFARVCAFLIAPWYSHFATIMYCGLAWIIFTPYLMIPVLARFACRATVFRLILYIILGRISCYFAHILIPPSVIL